MKQLKLNAGKSLINQTQLIFESEPRLRKLNKIINRQVDMNYVQSVQLFALTLEFKPSLIIELGRGYGNSTATLTQAANLLPITRKVLSICLSNDWQTHIVQKITPHVENNWFSKLEIYTADIVNFPLSKFINPKDSILFFWDAHGINVAEYVLGKLFPIFSKHKNIILVHDISDVRYNPSLSTYRNQGVWKGYDENQINPSNIIVNKMSSSFEEIVYLNDFAERNNIKIHSVEHEIRKIFLSYPEKQIRKLQKISGISVNQSISSIYWLSLNDQLKYFPKLIKTGGRHNKLRNPFMLKNNLPLVSIITPCFNSGKYIEECIQSVLNQDYPFVEHIIQDGNSTDETKKILHKYSTPKYHHRIKWVSEPDNGQSDGLDRALKRSSGNVLLVLNADDVLLPQACSWGIAMLYKHPDYAVIYGDEYIINENSEIVDIYIGKYPYIYDKLFCVELVPPAQAAFIRRSALENVGLFADKSLSTCPDFEMWVRIGAKYDLLHEFGIVCKYRHHLESEGKKPELIKQMVDAKMLVIHRVLNNRKTPSRIRRLRNRAYAGLYHWGANMSSSVGLYKRSLFYLLLSLYYRPRLHVLIEISRFLTKHGFAYTKNFIKKIG